MSSGEPERDTRERAELDQIDEREMRLRLLEALDRFIELNLAVHLVAVKGRTAIEYRIVLYPDGADTFEVAKIQGLADDYRLDFTMERDPTYDAGGLEGGWIVVLYPRS